MGGRVVTAMACIDGRALPAVQEWLRQHYNAIDVDVVTAPAMATWLAQGGGPHARAAAKISVQDHGSVAIAVASHAGCVAGPDDEDTMRNHIRAALDEVASWGLDVPIIGLFVDERRKARKVALLEA